MTSETARDRNESSAPHLGEGRQWVGGVSFVPADPEIAADHIISLAQGGIGRHVHLANAYTIALADKSPDYRSILAFPAINYPDGKPISWISRLRGDTPRLRQVRGPQLFLDVFDRGRVHGIKHFLLGSTSAVLKSLEDRLTNLYPGIQIVGSESPPFRTLGPVEIQEQDARIRRSGAQIVWVGLGTPKQDIEAQRLAGQLPMVAVAIGAAFDFAAGKIPEAPAWVSAIGFEWLYRLFREPRRLWKRYVFGNVRFLKSALNQSVGKWYRGSN